MTNFSPVDVDRVAAEVSPPERHALATAFRAQAAAENPDDPWLLLEQVFNIHLRPGNPSEPFGPMIVMDCRRSMIPSDLEDNQVDLLREVLAGSTAPAVRARIGDVLWVARRDGKAGHDAVRAYLALGTVLEDPEQWVPCMENYERAIRLARSLGQNGPSLAAALQHLLDRVMHHDGLDSSFFTSRGLGLLYEFRFGDAAQLGRLAIKGADKRRDAGNPYTARAYYEIAAKLLARAGLTDEAEDAREEVARTWVAEADVAEGTGNHIAAQAHLDTAIQAYRNIPRCKGLLPSLHRRLDAAGAEALKLMKPISSSPIDIGPMVRAAEESVRGRPMAEAVYALACAAPSLDPVKLREQVEKSAKHTLLSSMFSSVQLDRAGRVVHKSPGLFTDDPDEREQALDAEIAKRADLIRKFTVEAQILPALMALLGEHVVGDVEVLDLLQGSILVPEDRAGLFARGVAAGFRRDLVTATHLLVPQIEHALRALLRAAGVITASIDQDGIQSDWPLGRLLSAPEIRTVLPETLVFEMRSILVYKGSSNIRNTLCHGLMATEEFGTANVFYLWWLLLKVALHGTPGFQAWLDEKLRNGPNGYDDAPESPLSNAAQ